MDGKATVLRFYSRTYSWTPQCGGRCFEQKTRLLSGKPDLKPDNSLLSRVQQDALQDEEYLRYWKAAELGRHRDMEVRGGLLWSLPGSSQAPLTGGAARLYIPGEIYATSSCMRLMIPP